MSKLMKQYQELKKKDPNKIGLKLTNLSPEIVKCGFPIAKLEKYTHLLDNNDLKYELVTNQAPSDQSSYNSIINKIKNIDLNNTTCKEAFDILYNIQQKLKNIQ